MRLTINPGKLRLIMALGVALLSVAHLSAQQQVQIANPCWTEQYCYFQQQTGTIAANGTATITIQQPLTGAHQITLIAAVVQCPGQSFTVSQAQNGTGATATPAVPVPLWPTVKTATASIFTASNVGAGTATAPVFTYPAGISPQAIDLTMRTMGLSGIGNNYTVKLTNTGTASCANGGVALYWREK